MAKSYKSALPTWTTYTPYLSPLATQQAINAEPLWRNRAIGFQASSTHGAYNRIAMDIASQVKGTGSQHVVAGIQQHHPIAKILPQGRPSNLWHQRMQEAVQLGTPEAQVAPGESVPQTEMQRRAAHTAAPTVNPADVQTQQNARAGAETIGAAAVASSSAGTDTLGAGVFRSIYTQARSRVRRP